MSAHQYVERHSARAASETFLGDPAVSFIYSRVREDSGWLFRALTSGRLTELLGALRFDIRPSDPARMRRRLTRACGVDYTECADPPETLDTVRKVFERKIRYWERRPMDSDPASIVSPADARLAAGSLSEGSPLFLKDKFFGLDELLGGDKTEWREAFPGGDYAVLRLTPDKYHYNHTPVAGEVRDIYEIDGIYQSCHPGVLVAQATPHSKNRRTVTVIDTDTDAGTKAGLVAMVEIVALMIGDIAQRYSAEKYDDPVPVRAGMRLEKGCPKSLFRPGSSSVVLLFQPGRVRFADDILANLRRADLSSRYSKAWGVPFVETDVTVRSTIARAIAG